MSKEWRGRTDQSKSNSFDSSGSGGSGDGPSGGDLFLDLDEDDDSTSSSSTTSSDDEEEGFYVKVETIMGKSFQVYTYPSDNIELLKTRIAFQEGIPQKDQNLFASSRSDVSLGSQTLLSELGFLDSDSAKARPLRLITNISSGVGSKGYVTRDSSPPPPALGLPFLSHPLASRMRECGNGESNAGSRRLVRENLEESARTRRNNGRGDEPRTARLPKLCLDEEDLDGVLVFRDRDDHRVVVLIKGKGTRQERHPGDSSGPSTSDLLQRRLPTATSITSKKPEDNDNRRFLDQIRNRSGLTARTSSVLERSTQMSAESQRVLQRIRENARTLQKMTQIRNQMSKRRDCKGTAGTIEERENLFPDIFPEGNPIPFVKSSRRKKSASTCHKPDSPGRSIPLERGFTSTIASLNRLKAEIYLEAKKTGGGSCGILPYTDAQLCRYAQLKIKLLLAEQNPEGYEYSSHRFIPHSEPKGITPTAVMKRGPPKLFPRTNSGRGQRERLTIPVLTGRTDSSTSTCASDISIMMNGKGTSRIMTSKKIASNESLKSGHLRKQQSQIGLKSGRNIRSAGKRPSSGSLQGTSSTIQKKKKDVVRCAQCRKKIGLACRYQCRCGQMFCSTHRYAEAHTCTFDYKTAGRKQLEETNPVIVANKVDKI